MFKKITVLFLLFILLTSCHAARFVGYNFIDHDDYKKFQNVEIKKGENTFYFKDNSQESSFKFPKTIQGKKKNYSFNDALNADKTVAFLVIQNDSIQYEKYFDGFDKSSLQASFSMSKSFLSALVGMAVNDGKIKSIKEPITNYLPDLNKEDFQHISIENLLDMRSGIKSNKDFLNPFGQLVKMYYGRNMKKYMRQVKVAYEPNLKYEYSNVNSQLLSQILINATNIPLQENLENRIWKPLGMEYNATWSIDSKKHKTIKAFCCMNASARDYAKIGRLYLNNGKWNNKQLVPKNWVKKSEVFTNTKNNFRYSNHWKHSILFETITDSTNYPKLYVDGGSYIDRNNKKQQFIIYPYPSYFAVGILGQFIYIHPEKNLIIVRLGKQDKYIDWENLFIEIAELN